MDNQSESPCHFNKLMEISLTEAYVTLTGSFFGPISLNRASDQSFYVIELNFVSFVLPKSEFLPRTMKISK